MLPAIIFRQPIKNMSSPDFNPAVYRARREKLLCTIFKKHGASVVLMPTAPEMMRNRDTAFPFRAESYFYYLSAFAEPEAVLALCIDHRENVRHILFCREKHEEREIWEGFRYGPHAAGQAFSFDETYPIGALADRLPELLTNRQALYTPLGLFPDWDHCVTQALKQVRAKLRDGDMPPTAMIDVRDTLDTMRMTKDAHEIALMRHAAKISASAHTQAIQKTKPGLFEYQIEAELLHTFLYEGAQATAYPSIVASGENACVLHYTENRRQMKDGDLLLIDAGCEYQYYASDITRTFPVGKRFSAAQKDVYEIVLAAQQACFNALKPGMPLSNYHEAAERVLAQGMIDLKLLTGSLDDALESGAFRRFYMHRAGHWLGMDVHDAGAYCEQDTQASIPLAPGMVLTVEPGLYIRAADDVPTALRNIGVRIEDNVLITESGIDILTRDAPKSVAEIETLRQTS